MTLALVGKSLVLRGLPSKIEVMWVLGIYNLHYPLLLVQCWDRTWQDQIYCKCTLWSIYLITWSHLRFHDRMFYCTWVEVWVTLQWLNISASLLRRVVVWWRNTSLKPEFLEVWRFGEVRSKSLTYVGLEGVLEVRDHGNMMCFFCWCVVSSLKIHVCLFGSEKKL